MVGDTYVALVDGLREEVGHKCVTSVFAEERYCICGRKQTKQNIGL